MKKVLIIGNCNHYFNRKLVAELQKNDSNILIDFFSINKPDHSLILPYNLVSDFSINKKELSFFLKVPGIYTLYCYWCWNRALKKKIKDGNYDYIHIQGLEVWQIGIHKLHKRIILTVWGSDFLRLSKTKLGIFKPFVSKLYKITFATKEVSNKFHEIFNTKEKHTIVKFG